MNGVKALESEIKAQVALCRQKNIKHVLFTGHSAGGAVASLAFMHLLGNAKKDST